MCYPVTFVTLAKGKEKAAEPQSFAAAYVVRGLVRKRSTHERSTPWF